VETHIATIFAVASARTATKMECHSDTAMVVRSPILPLYLPLQNQETHQNTQIRVIQMEERMAVQMELRATEVVIRLCSAVVV
jgi:hypothetical protein